VNHAVIGPVNNPLVSRPFGGGDIAQLRAVLARLVTQAGLGGERSNDFVLAVDEILTNAVRHGGGAGHLEVWVETGRIWFRITDRGSGMTVEPPSAPPAPTQLGGRGLWIARGLTDEMTIATGPGGTEVAGAVNLPAPAESTMDHR